MAVITHSVLSELAARRYVLLLGGSGRLGQECKAHLRELGIPFWSPMRSEIDMGNLNGIAKLLATKPPVLIVNAAAFTDVDAAESHRSEARLINAEVPSTLAEIASKLDIRLIQISTDFVFSGQEGRAYHEDDEPNPINWYGATKRAGERAALMAAPSTIVLRTAWLHGNGRPSFVHAFARKLANGERVRAIADRFGSPTSADALAGQIAAICKAVLDGDDVPGGIYHAAGKGSASPFEIAHVIAGELEADVSLIAASSASELADIAPRPVYAVLDCQKIEEILGLPCQHWQDGISHTIQHAGIHGRRVA